MKEKGSKTLIQISYVEIKTPPFTYIYFLTSLMIP